ncbi:unnamed protein product [Caenorhabditis brenneri]
MSGPSTFDKDRAMDKKTFVPPEALKLLESRAFEPVPDPGAKSFSRPRSRRPKNSYTLYYNEKQDGPSQAKSSYSSINLSRPIRNEQEPRLSYSSIDLSRRIQKEEEPNTSLVTDLFGPNKSGLQEIEANERSDREKPFLLCEHKTPSSKKNYGKCSYSSIDLSRRIEKEEKPNISLVTDLFGPQKPRIQEDEENGSTDREEPKLLHKPKTSTPEKKYESYSYSSIDLSRRIQKEEESNISYYTDVFSPRASRLKENGANASTDREEPNLPNEHGTVPPEKKYESYSYSSIDLSRRIQKEEEPNTSLVTDLFGPNKSGLQEIEANERSDREEPFLLCEHKTPSSKKNYGKCPYSSIDLTRRIHDEEEQEVSYVTYAYEYKPNPKEKIGTDGSGHDLSCEQSTAEIPKRNQCSIAETYGRISLEKRIRPENQECDVELESLVMVDDSEKKDSEKRKVDAKTEDVIIENNSPSNPAVSCKTIGDNPSEPRKKSHYIDRKFVAHPKKTIEGTTPQRPFPKELYWYNPKVSGTATEIFDMIFPANFKNQPNYKPWTHGNFEAPMIQFRKLEEKRQEALRSYQGIEEDERKRQKQHKILERLQNILWLVHSKKKDEMLEKTLRLMLQKFLCRLDETQKLKIISNEDLSLVWNGNIGIENSSILSQREHNWDIKPVFIDGLSLIDSICSDTSNLPVLPTKVLIEVLLHFTLDGHKTAVYLPDVYKSNNNVDDLSVFNFLCNLEIITFVNKRNRKAVERAVLADAEKSCGIIVSTSEDLSQKIVSSIQCFPVLNKYSAHEFIINTIFGESKNSNTNLESSHGSSDHVPEFYQDLSERCRIYTELEKEQIDASQHQLTLERQVYLVSSLVHITTFHFQRQRQIEVFLMAINRFVPQLLPHFMQKSTIDEISVAIQTLRDRNNLQHWPIFSNQ